MAVFSGFLAAQLGAALVSIGVKAALASTVANVVVGAGMMVAGQALMRARMPKGGAKVDNQAVVNQAAASRVRGYGTMKLGGVRAFLEANGGGLDQVIVLHHGEIDSFEAFFVGDRRVELDADGWVTTEPWGKDGDQRIRIESRLGKVPSPAYQSLIELWPEKWTEAHRLDGLATICARMKSVKAQRFNKLYPEAHNTPFRALCNLSRTYDPRSGLTEWSKNPAMHARDFLTHEDGFRIPAGEIDDTSFSNFASICDELVPRKNGSYERRYTHSGVYSLDADPKDTLGAILATCDAEVYENVEGKIAIRGGLYVAPTVTIYPEHILAFEIEGGNGLLSAFNELTGSYTDPSRDYQPNDTPPRIDAADQAIRGRLTEVVDLSGVHSPTQAQRLVKIAYQRENPRWKGRISTTLAGLEARDEANIRLVMPELGIDGPFRVESHAIRADLTGCDIELSSVEPAAWDWIPETEEGEISPPLPAPPPIADLAAPEGLTLAFERRQITASTTAPVIVATVDEPARDDLDLDAEYRIVPSGAWEGMTSAGLRAVSGPVVNDGQYEVRARWRTAMNGAGEWSGVEAITITD